MSEQLHFGAPLRRVTKALDGSVFVEGLCTSDDLDTDDQIIDKDFARSALTDWYKGYGNIRQMHSTMLAPGGRAVNLEERPEGFWLTSKVVEPGAVRLVREGAYQGRR